MKTLIWKGIAYQSLEYFNLKENNENYIVESRIIGSYKKQIYNVSYNLTIDKNWTIQEFNIESEVNTVKNRLIGKKLQNNWEINNAIDPGFKDFIFIDISLTPFTNTLPINHSHIPKGGSQEIKVIYIDVLNNIIKPAPQLYTRISEDQYRYENLLSDFKADILVDENGLVVNYPGLFEKMEELS